MNPLKPKDAVPRLKELLGQYSTVIIDMGKAITSQDISSLERKGLLIIQEICMTAPLLHDALMVYSQEARKEMRARVMKEQEKDA